MEDFEIELYFKYRKLSTADMALLFKKLDVLFISLVKRSYMTEKTAYLFYEENSPHFLELSNINTGNSINIKFKEGWKPSLDIKKAELNVHVPVNLGIPVIIVYLMLGAAQKLMSIRNEYLDGELKNYELTVKEMKYNRKGRLEPFETDYKSNTPSKLYHRTHQKQAQSVIEFLLNNPDIYHLEINDMVIKDESKDK